MSSFISVIGIFVLLGIGFLFSNNKKAINYRTIFLALLLQVLIGAFVLYVPWGRDILLGAANGVSNVIAYGNEGVKFIFGGLVTDASFKAFGNDGFIFAFRVLPTIIFFSALISVLYYLGIMQVIINILGGALQKLLGTSKAESMSAAANIFVGQTEAPLVVKPYIGNMTKSEFFAIMGGGMASISGSLLAAYAGMGVPLTYLIAASFMAAPGGLLFSKLVMPQTEKYDDNIHETEIQKDSHILEAASNGALSGLKLAAHMGAMLLALIALIAMVNGLLGFVGSFVGLDDLSLNMIFAYIFKPLAYIIGVPWEHAGIAGEMMGFKIAVNEFVGYAQFAQYLGENAPVLLDEKTKAIVIFALCGFANLASIAVLLGGIGTLAPKRRPEIAKWGLKVVLVGSLSNLMSAAIAGLFIGIGGGLGL